MINGEKNNVLTKYVNETLRQGRGETDMGEVTIKDIAREAGVSIASVSRALNGMDGISEENRSRILMKRQS